MSEEKDSYCFKVAEGLGANGSTMTYGGIKEIRKSNI
jgi:hypothetical protein